MLNYIWLALIVCSVLLGGYSNRLGDVTGGAFDGARTAVMTIALPLVGAMCIWLGVMRLAERSGLVQALARALRPVLSWLFPDVPAGHPAMGSMVMNIAANMLGLGNAATPLGLRAMGDLEKLNPQPGTATNAMCTFLAINTSSVQLLPTTAIAILAANGSKDPSAIVGTALVATTCACITGVSAAKFLQKLPVFAPARQPAAASVPACETATVPPPGVPVKVDETADEQTPPLAPLTGGRMAALGFIALLAAAFILSIFSRNVFWPPVHAADWTAGVGEYLLRAVKAVSTLAVPCTLAFFPAVRRPARDQGLRAVRRRSEGRLPGGVAHHSISRRHAGRHRHVPAAAGGWTCSSDRTGRRRCSAMSAFLPTCCRWS